MTKSLGDDMHEFRGVAQEVADAFHDDFAPTEVATLLGDLLEIPTDGEFVPAEFVAELRGRRGKAVLHCRWGVRRPGR